MTFQVRFFLAFAFFASVGAGGVWLYSANLDYQLLEAVRACEAEGKPEVADESALTKAGDVGPWTRYRNAPWVNDPWVCEPSKLNYVGFDSSAGTGNGPQQRVMRSYMATLSAPNVGLTCLFAIFLILFGAVPAGWYFFLRRLREIAAAVRAE